MNHFSKGVVQGMNTAALLGLVVLEALKVYDVKDGKYIGYADDGIIMCNDPEEIDRFRMKLRTFESGVRIKAEKSGWVVFDGIWKKRLKFVGAEFDGKDLYAKTHSGKEWKMEWKFNPDWELLRGWRYNPNSKWKSPVLN